MADNMERLFYEKIGAYLYLATRRKYRTNIAEGYNLSAGFGVRKEKDGDVFTLTSTLLLPVCKVRKFALNMEAQYDLSCEGIKELHQKLPGYLYSAKPGPYFPQLSKNYLEEMRSILETMKEICSQKYYSFLEEPQ